MIGSELRWLLHTYQEDIKEREREREKLRSGETHTGEC